MGDISIVRNLVELQIEKRSDQKEDIGLHTKNWERFSGCGTPAYVAPQVILSRAYSCKVDIWALGILAFELLAGVTFFEANTAEETYRRILMGEISWPTHLSASWKEFIKSLLKPSPYERFSIDQIKSHRFFNQIDWISMEQGNCLAKHRPVFSNVEDLRYFQARNNAIQLNTEWKMFSGDSLQTLRIQPCVSKTSNALKYFTADDGEVQHFISEDFFLANPETLSRPCLI